MLLRAYMPDAADDVDAAISLLMLLMLMLMLICHAYALLMPLLILLPLLMMFRHFLIIIFALLMLFALHALLIQRYADDAADDVAFDAIDAPRFSRHDTILMRAIRC